MTRKMQFNDVGFDKNKIREFLQHPGRVARESQRDSADTKQSFGTLPYDEDRLVEKAKETIEGLRKR